MGTKMTYAARAELTNLVRRRYCAAAGAEKRRILDEFIGKRVAKCDLDPWFGATSRGEDGLFVATAPQRSAALVRTRPVLIG